VLTHLRRNAVAYLALFVALGGTSYAAVKLPANSVGAKQIKANAVGASEVKRGAVGLSELSNRAEGTLKAQQGPAGPRGTIGPAGPTGSPAGSVIQGSTDATLVASGGSEDVFAPSGFTKTGTTGAGPTSIQSTPAADVVIRDLYGQVNTAPGGAATRIVRLQAFNPPRILISCTISGNATSCDSGDASVVVPAGTQYRASIFTGNGAAVASVGASWAFRVLTP
jgi:hypothetical protein